MDKDPELKAMSEIANALSTLEPEAVSRVLKWALDRFQIKFQNSITVDKVHGIGQREISRDGFADFASFYDAANPQLAIEKALVAGYWFQVIQNNDEFDSGSLNRELRHLGHPSTNITRDLDVLISKSPRLVLQIRKSGPAKQARKTYKLTTEGIRAVERMLTKNKDLSKAEE